MANQPLDKNDPLKGKKSGKWSKHGGAVYGMVKEEIVEEWSCQICGQKSPKELKPFLYELFPGDYIRVCNTCAYIIQKIPSGQSYQIFVRVKKIVRKLY